MISYKIEENLDLKDKGYIILDKIKKKLIFLNFLNKLKIIIHNYCDASQTWHCVYEIFK